jgi:hypothetical protein
MFKFRIGQEVWLVKGDQNIKAVIEDRFYSGNIKCYKVDEYAVLWETQLFRTEQQLNRWKNR